MGKTKKYNYFSGKESNITKLQSLLDNYRHAAVLDKFAFLSINSTFVLPTESSSNGWFCVEYKQLGKMTGYSERTIKVLVKLFSSLNLIEKIRKIVNNKNRACIRLSKKALKLLNITATDTITCVKPTDETNTVEQGGDNNSSARKNLAQKCTFESAQNAPAYKVERKKDKKNTINIITHIQTEKKRGQLYGLPENVEKMFSDIGERLEQNQKAAIWGAVINLQKQHKQAIANPAEFVAWVAFSILHADHQLQGTAGFSHRLNTIMLLAREGRYLRPIGFHSQWDIGKRLQKQSTKARQRVQQEKETYAQLSKQSPLNLYDKAESAVATKGRFDKTPDGDNTFVFLEEKEKDTGELIELKREKAKLMQQVQYLAGEIKQSEQLLKSNRAGEGILSKLKIRAKVSLSESQEKKISTKLHENKMELAQYRQAINEIEQHIKNAAEMLSEKYERRLPDVALFELATS